MTFRYTMSSVVNMNEYEQAVQRLNDAKDSLLKIREEILRLEDREDAAEREYMSAHANLRQYEDKPGIPKPEYR